MAAMTTTLSGSSVAALANRLSSSSAFGSPQVQQLGIVRPSAKASKVVAARASSNNEDRSSKKPQMLVALVAAGAALALNAAPVSSAQAGLFGGDAKVERGGTAPDFPGNEGTGTTVGENSSVRGAASSGTPLGEASKSGSGTPLGNTVAETAKDAVEAGIDINIDPLKTRIGDINPLTSTLNASEAAADAKSTAMDVAADVKSKLPGGN